MDSGERRTLDTARFESLRDTVAIAARQMSRAQALEVVDHVLAALSRREEVKSWEDAREGGTFGFS
jgi:hypothetical protein